MIKEKQYPGTSWVIDSSSLMENWSLNLIRLYGCGSVVVGTLDFRSECRWFNTQSLPFCVVSLDKKQPHIISRYPSYKMGTSNILLGITLLWTSITSRGE